MSDSDPNSVQIHLSLEQNGDTIHVDFAFDTLNDDLDTVVGDLIATLEIGKEQTAGLKALILDQIKKAKSSGSSAENPSPPSPIQSPPINPPTDSEDILNDPEYIHLVEQQNKELEEMEARHLLEQQNLAAKLTAVTTDDDLLIF